MLLATIVVLGAVSVVMVKYACRSTRRHVGMLVVELQGAAGARLRIFSGWDVVVAAIGELDTGPAGGGLVLGSGLPREGQEVADYHFESLRTGHTPCVLTIAVAGLGQDLGAGIRAPIRREGDASPSLPAVVAIFWCRDLVGQFATRSEHWRSNTLLILEGELEVTAREGDALVGTLTAPLVLSSRLF